MAKMGAVGSHKIRDDLMGVSQLGCIYRGVMELPWGDAMAIAWRFYRFAV
jgi:hypothetical protein